MNGWTLRIEGFAILAISTYVYFFYFQFSLFLFILLLFVPDVSMAGYLKNNKVGALGYNLFHTYSIPAAIILLGVSINQSTLLMIGITWIAHIGMDRMLGLGLKYPTSFKDTHLNRV